MNQKKEETPAEKLVYLVGVAKDALKHADKLARTIPEASSVRPTISQCKDALSGVGFGQEVGRL
jgi:hypothetical protein